MIFTAVATDSLENTQTTTGTNLRALIEKCQEAAEVYGVEVWVENDAESIVWHPDVDKITQES